MSKDISASRQKRWAELTKRFTDAVRINQAATDRFDEVMCQFLGINRTDGRCLDIIDRLGRVSAGQLANESGLTTGAVTALIDRLEKAGYVRRIRDTLDRRKIWVEVTDTTRTINRHIFGLYGYVGPTMVQRFNPAELKAIMEFLEVGTLLQQELAASLKEYTDPSASTAEKRHAQAMLFDKAMQANAPRLREELDAITLNAQDFDAADVEG